jgi:hypothetical protein
LKHRRSGGIPKCFGKDNNTSTAAFGTREEVFSVLQYDTEGRTVDVATRDNFGAAEPSTPKAVAYQRVRYNGFGEITPTLKHGLCPRKQQAAILPAC